MTIRSAVPNDAPIIADSNIRMAWETEKRRLNPETASAGVVALINDPAKGIYYVAEERVDGSPLIIGQLSITYEWSDWRNGNSFQAEDGIRDVAVETK